MEKMTISGAMQASKASLRSQIRRILKNLDSVDKESQSRTICQRIQMLDEWKSARNISVFISMESEPNTDSLIEALITNDSKKCFVPRYDESSRYMDMVLVESLAQYRSFPLTKWNIRQPSLQEPLKEALQDHFGLDLVIVPGMAFSRSGLRLGHGKGYYDSYLLKCKESGLCPNLKTIGVAFREQILEEVPSEEHDHAVDILVYP